MSPASPASATAALLLLGYAGALRRSELIGVDREHITFHAAAIELLIPRSK